VSSGGAPRLPIKRSRDKLAHNVATAILLALELDPS
jgi:hypothetical protein